MDAARERGARQTQPGMAAPSPSHAPVCFTLAALASSNFRWRRSTSRAAAASLAATARSSASLLAASSVALGTGRAVVGTEGRQPRRVCKASAINLASWGREWRGIGNRRAGREKGRKERKEEGEGNGRGRSSAEMRRRPGDGQGISSTFQQGCLSSLKGGCVGRGSDLLPRLCCGGGEGAVRKLWGGSEREWERNRPGFASAESG